MKFSLGDFERECPVCKGKGKLPLLGATRCDSKAPKRTCHLCHGNGRI
jgi:DnaJ-class molecular chaperone